jgi:trigger factor
MDIQVEKTGPYNRKLSVTLPAQQVDTAFEQAYRKIAKQARIPGFRPGKAPRSVLEAHYGAQVRDEVENQLVVDSLKEAIEREKVDPVSRPRVDPGKLEKGASFSYTAELEVRPEIVLKKYKGLEYPDVQADIGDKEVDAEIETLRQQATQLVPVLVRDTVEKGDLVLVDYEGFMGGSPIHGTKAENAIIETDAEGYLPGFAEALLGAKVPSDRSIPIDFPADYPVEHLRGKKATFQVKVKELKKKELPTVDDEFAKDIGEESLEALRAKIREGVAARKKQETDSARKDGLLKSLCDANPFDVPPSMISEQVDRMIGEAVMRVRQMMGGRFDFSGLDVEALRKDNRERAEMQVRSGLLLLEVAKAEGVKVDDEEIEAEIGRMTENDHQAAAQWRQPEQRERLSYKLLEQKTLELLMASGVAVAPQENAK